MNYGHTRQYTFYYSLPALILICMFAFCVFLGASFGIRSYNTVYEGSERNFIGRTGLTYIATKLRQTDIISASAAAPHELLLTEEIDGQRYTTRIFIKDGALIEAFGRAGEDFGGLSGGHSGGDEFL